MPLEKSYNISPYFDDFNQAKDFYKVLFKPGVAVQTRELNQLQTLLQSQIERFGDHVFKSGTIVSGVNFSYIPVYNYVKILDVQGDGQPSVPQAYVDYFIKSGLNLTARIVNYEDGLESRTPDLKTLYLQYINSSDPDTSNGNISYTQFAPGETLTIFSKNNEIFKYNVQSGGLGFANADSLVIMSAIGISGNSGAFNAGDTITQAGGARAQILYVNTTIVSNTVVLGVKPLLDDLTNTAVTSTAWTLQKGVNVVDANTSATANVVAIYGSGAQGYLTTDALGIVQSIAVADGGSDYTILPHVTIKTANAVASYSNPSLNVVPQNYKTTITVGNNSINSVGTGYAFGVSEGVIYQKGHFLRVDPQIIVVDKFTTSPNNVSVGFNTVETVITASSDDTLYDNASNTTNFAAPGADRLQLVPKLIKKTIDEASANAEFFVLAEWKEGFPYKENRSTVYSGLAEEFARRTRESAGDYVGDMFSVTTRDKNVANNNYINVLIDPGFAYISGYRVSTSYNNYLDIKRSQTTSNSSNHSVTVNYGNFLYVKELAGFFKFIAGDTVELYNTAKGYVTAGTMTTSGSITPQGTKIGTARIRSIMYDSGVMGTASCVYRLYLFDINISAGYTFRNVRSVFYNGTPEDGICDAVLVQDPTTSTSIAVLQDTAKDQMLFPVGITGVTSIDNVTYTYRTASNTSLTSSGNMSIGPLGGTAEHPYTHGATLSSVEERDLFLIPQSNNQAAANQTGTFTVTAGSANVTGTTAGWTANFEPGDFIRLGNTSTANDTASARVVGQVNAIINSTAVSLVTAPSNSVTGNAVLFFPALYPINLGRTGRTATNSSDGKTLTINVNASLASTVNAIAIHNVRQANATPVSKTVKRNLYVKIDTATNVNGVEGPWSLGIPGVFRLKNVYKASNSSVTTSSTDVTKYFSVDVGEEENASRNAQLVLNIGAPLTITSGDFLLAEVDAFTTNGNEGFFTFNSYTVNATANLTQLSANSSAINLLELPEVCTTKGVYFDTRDVIDFRPFASNTAALANTVGSATVNPANTFALSGDNQFFPVPDSVVSFNVQFYNGRVDRVVARKDGTFEVLEGAPAPTNPVAPPEQRDSMTLSILKVPPYPSIPSALNSFTTEFAAKRTYSPNGSVNKRLSNFRVTQVRARDSRTSQPRRYSMKDIGALDRRLQAVEYQTSLNQVEAAVKELTIPSAIAPTTNRFKNGFFVDTFDNYTKVDTTHKEYAATIDQGRGFLKPPTRQVNFESQFDRSHANTAAGIVNGDTLMLPFTSVVLVDQSIKSSVIGTTGQKLQFVGDGTITPSAFSILARGEVTLVADPSPASYDGGGYSDNGGGGMSGEGTAADGSSSDGGGGGGGGGCFTADTLVTLFDRTQKRIADIVVGDLVLDAFSNTPNKVIGIKTTEYKAGRQLFTTNDKYAPYITEEHPFFDNEGSLCAISDVCEYQAPWLGPVKIVEVAKVVDVEAPITVYNLMLENGFTHYANGQKVHNIVGNGNMFILNMRGWLSEEDYKGYITLLEDAGELDAWPASAKARMYNITAAINTFVLRNDNILGRVVGKSVACAVKHREKLLPVFGLWFRSGVRKMIFGK
jgi:hypothetical protein